jgi:hypothetical protein
MRKIKTLVGKFEPTIVPNELSDFNSEAEPISNEGIDLTNAK